MSRKRYNEEFKRESQAGDSTGGNGIGHRPGLRGKCQHSEALGERGRKPGFRTGARAQDRDGPGERAAQAGIVTRQDGA